MAQYLEEHKETLLSNNPEEYIAVKMDLEAQGWVNNNGDVLITENELIENLKLEEKIKKLNTKVVKPKKKPVLTKKRGGPKVCDRSNCTLCKCVTSKKEK